MRVVLDTNVLLSALLFRTGRLIWLRAAWMEARILPLVSRETAEELLRVLAYPKFRSTPDERNNLLADYLPWCETVAVPPTYSAEIERCRDPDDRKFLALALVGKADALITGDADLLALADAFPLRICTPAAFAELA